MSKVNDKFLLNRLKAMYGKDFDPIMNMAKNAVLLQAKVDSAEAGDNEANHDLSATLIDVNKEWERIAQFTSPKLKSMEIKGDGEAIQVHIHRGGDKKDGG